MFFGPTVKRQGRECIICVFVTCILISATFNFILEIFVPHYTSDLSHLLKTRKLTDPKQFHILIVVPGIGDIARLDGLKLSLSRLLELSNNHVSVGCLVYVWNISIFHTASQQLLPFCDVKMNNGLWTDHMLAVGDDLSVEGNVVSHLALLIDDIDVTKIDLARFLNLMTKSSFGMASASFPQWHYPILHPRIQCSSHRSDFADILFSVFTIEAWRCWRGLISSAPENKFGWGFDLVFSDKCNITIGVIDEDKGSHEGKCSSGGDCTRSYDENEALTQLWNYIIRSTSASTIDEARGHHHLITSERPSLFPLCTIWNPEYVIALNQTGLKLRLVDDSYYKTVTHRGGWRVVIQYLIDEKVIVRDNSYNTRESSPPVLFFDLTEKHFFWEQRGYVREPWVGIMHLSLGVPAHIESSLYLENLLNHIAFQGSLVHCLALIVLTDEMRRGVTTFLNEQGIFGFNICTLRHPLTVEANASKFKTSDLDMIFGPNSGVLLLGQQYRRLATIHKLKTNRRKLWLPGMPPGTPAAKHVLGRLEGELEADNVSKPDDSVEFVYSADFTEYDDYVKHNLVIIDLWAATANNAVLEAIALNIPVLVRKLPGTVEYLGLEYPLLFENVSMIEAIINQNPTKLRKLLTKAHNYLLQMDKRVFSMQSFTDNLHSCVVHGFKL